MPLPRLFLLPVSALLKHRGAIFFILLHTPLLCRISLLQIISTKCSKPLFICISTNSFCSKVLAICSKLVEMISTNISTNRPQGFGKPLYITILQVFLHFYKLHLACRICGPMFLQFTRFVEMLPGFLFVQPLSRKRSLYPRERLEALRLPPSASLI